MWIGTDCGVVGDALPAVVGVAVGEFPYVLLAVVSPVILCPVPGVVVENSQRPRRTNHVDGSGHVLAVCGRDELSRPLVLIHILQVEPEVDLPVTVI